MVQSNTLLINDVPIENIIDVKVSTNYCESCSSIIGKDSYCRTVIFDGNEYEDIPAKAIRQAVYKILGGKKLVCDVIYNSIIK